MRKKLVLVVLVALASSAAAQEIRTYRPFGTLREQAERQQRWLMLRMFEVLPMVMRKHHVEMWVVPMREYNEDPVFTAIVSATTFAARRRTIYVFYDECTKPGVLAAQREREMRPLPRDTREDPPSCKVQRIALGGASQGGLFNAVRSTKAAAGPAGAQSQRQAELWGDEQWQVLKKVIEERNPKTINVDVSRTFAFSDGLSAGELEGMRAALGPKWSARFRRNDAVALDVIATRLPDEEMAYQRMTQVVWGIIDTAFSNAVITPGITRTQDVVWWMRQKVNDLGLGTWFQPSVEVQRMGASDEQLGDNPIILRGDVLHCDFGITAYRLNTDTQHMGYVLRDGETDVPPGIQRALENSNKLQDIVMAEIRPGRTGNEILRASLARMRAEGIDGTVYTHPIGLHGHGAGPLIGLWDYQDGVAGRGDAKVIPSMWFSIELQATTPVPEWNDQKVRSAQEEDAIVDAEGRIRWAWQRQTRYWLVR
jgi:hypothetical protein